MESSAWPNLQPTDIVSTNLTNESALNWTVGYTNDTFEEDSVYVFSPLPWWRQILWSFLFGSMATVATVGNLVVIWIVLAHKRMRTVTNYLLVNLSIADTIVSTINVIPNYIYMSTQHWPFGTIYCKLVQFVAALSISASTFTLMAISFDRYTAIMNPLKPRMGRRLTLGIAGGIWVGGIILSLPNLIFFTTFEHENGVVTCYGEWPDGATTNSFHEYLYNVFFMIFTYFVPIVVMGYTYTRVGIELWGSQSIGEATQRQLENIKSKRRVVKMMMVLVSSFGICWFPFQLYFILVSMVPAITAHPSIQEIFLGVYWLAMSNSMYNPIIYCWLNARFRRGFQQVFSWCPCIHYTTFEGGGPSRTICEVRRSGGVAAEGVTNYSVTGSPEIHMRLTTRNGGGGGGNLHIPLHVLTSSHHQHHKFGSGNHLTVGMATNNGQDTSSLCVNKHHQHNSNSTSRLRT